MRIRWIGGVVVSLATLHGCGDSGTTLAKRGDGGQTDGCTKDTDCKGDRICENGECVSPSGDSGSGATGGSSSSSGGRSTATGGRTNGGSAGAGGGTSGTGGGADSGSPGGAGNGGAGNGGVGGRGGAGGNAAGGAAPGPQCTAQDTSACPPAFPFGACCTTRGACGFMYPPFGCIGGTSPGDAGTGAGGAPPGGGLVSTACKTCRATNCSTEAAACNGNAACAALSTCIDNASPFNLLNCLTGVTTQARTLYNALSSCATTNCTATVCPNISI